jgi:hypothetical protein
MVIDNARAVIASESKNIKSLSYWGHMIEWRCIMLEGMGGAIYRSIDDGTNCERMKRIQGCPSDNDCKEPHATHAPYNVRGKGSIGAIAIARVGDRMCGGGDRC